MFIGSSIVPHTVRASVPKTAVQFEGNVRKIINSCFSKVGSSKRPLHVKQFFEQLETCEAFYSITNNKIAAAPIAIPVGYSAYKAALFIVGVIGSYCVAIDCVKNATEILERLSSYGRTLFQFEGNKLEQYDQFVQKELSKQNAVRLEARKENPDQKRKKPTQQKETAASGKGTSAKRPPEQQQEKTLQEYQECLKIRTCQRADELFGRIKTHAETLKKQLEEILKKLNERTSNANNDRHINDVQKSIKELEKLLAEKPPSQRTEPPFFEKDPTIHNELTHFLVGSIRKVIKKAASVKDQAHLYLNPPTRK